MNNLLSFLACKGNPKRLCKVLFTLALIFIFGNSKLSAQSFIGSFVMVSTQEYTNGNVRNDTVRYYFGEEKTAVFITGRRSDSDMRMIFNPLDTTIICLFEMNGKKGGFVLPMDLEHWPGMSHAHRPFPEKPSSELNYSGKEKVVEGMTCREVLAENDDYSAKLWIAEEIPLSMTRVLSYQSVGKGESKEEVELFDQFGVSGLPLILFLKSKKGKADVTIRLQNFSESVDDAVFDSSGYTLSKID